MSRFNLVTDAWIPVKEQAKPIRVQDIVNPAFTALDAPRADFNAALVQFLIGLVQTVFAPNNPREWRKYYETPPSPELLQEKLDLLKPAFYIDGDGKRFMQDISLRTNGNQASVLKLLPALIGDNTTLNNMDFFVKSSDLRKFSISNVVIGLYLYQNYCLSETGGANGRHHGSFRGRNSMISLLQEKKANLWKNIWLNIISNESFQSLTETKDSVTAFEWMQDEPFSKQKTDSSFYLSDLYWSMPRRVFLDFSNSEQSNCSLTNQNAETMTNIVIKEDGIEYKTHFTKHPLIPYRNLEKNKNNPIGGVAPVKLNGAGINYGDWLSLIGTDTASMNMNEHFRRNTKGEFNIFVCGYLNHSTQAKTLCWYETNLPFFISDLSEAERKKLEHETSIWIDSSKHACEYLVTAIENAWFGKNSEKNKTQKKAFKNEKASYIRREFWRASETQFYLQVKRLTNELSVFNDSIETQYRKEWHRVITYHALQLFNQFAFKSHIRTNPKRIALAFNGKEKKGKKIIYIGIKPKLNSSFFRNEILKIH